jgi:type VI secretion system secreted protein VgrG
VAQNWSGNGWGGMVIPRVGMEVLVEFLDGDPDKPLVTGCVYNGRNKVPYELPRHKTRSTFRTDTHQGTGFNELRFEDANGEEEIYVHAQKDRNTVIENDDTKLVGRNAVSRIKGGLLSDVDKSAFTNIDGSLFLDVGSLGKSASANMARSLDGIELKGFAAGFNKKYMGVADKGEIAVSNSGNFILTSGQSALLNAG